MGTQMKAEVDKNKCIGCGTCVSLCPEYFELKNGIARVKKNAQECKNCNLREVADSCPTQAITISEN